MTTAPVALALAFIDPWLLLPAVPAGAGLMALVWALGATVRHLRRRRAIRRRLGLGRHTGS